MQRYRKKPVEIEAVLWEGTSESFKECHEFMNTPLEETVASWSVNKRQIFINTLEGIMTASVGDYIIKGVQGEFYPCKFDIFHLTYERVDDM